MVLIVCPAASVVDVCRERAPSHLVSLTSPGLRAPEVEGVPHRLALAFNDVVAPISGYVTPDGVTISEILAFGRSWDGARPLVVHCEFGISRSTAVAFALACQIAPPGREAEIASALRAASPVATPNPLLVMLADAGLDRRGRMVAAIAGIGRGAAYAPYRAFDLGVDP